MTKEKKTRGKRKTWYNLLEAWTHLSKSLAEIKAVKRDWRAWSWSKESNSNISTSTSTSKSSCLSSNSSKRGLKSLTLRIKLEYNLLEVLLHSSNEDISLIMWVSWVTIVLLLLLFFVEFWFPPIYNSKMYCWESLWDAKLNCEVRSANSTIYELLRTLCWKLELVFTVTVLGGVADWLLQCGRGRWILPSEGHKAYHLPFAVTGYNTPIWLLQLGMSEKFRTDGWIQTNWKFNWIEKNW